jgi:YHS domain-containing protein
MAGRRCYRYRLLTLLSAMALVAGGLALWVNTRPVLALDGYCPVKLTRDLGWQAGKPDLTATYRGQLFHFADPQCQKAFESNPKAFVPAMGGADVVLLLEEGRRAPGERRFGYRYGGRCFLFTGADAMRRFSTAPGKYLAFVQQAEK